MGRSFNVPPLFMLDLHRVNIVFERSCCLINLVLALDKIVLAIAFRRENLAFCRENIVLAVQNDVFPDRILIESA